MRKFLVVKSLIFKTQKFIGVCMWNREFHVDSGSGSILIHNLFGIEIQIQSHCQFQK